MPLGLCMYANTHHNVITEAHFDISLQTTEAQTERHC